MNLLACAAPDPLADNAENPASTYAYLFEEAVAPGPLLTAAAVADAISNAVRDTRSLGAPSVLATWATAMQEGAGVCPVWTETASTASWRGHCTAPSGAEFSGYGVERQYDYMGTGAVRQVGQAVYGRGFVVTRDGSTFEMGGVALALEATPSDRPAGTPGAWVGWRSRVEGSFAWSGSGGGWLATEVTPELELLAYEWESGARLIQLTGVIGGPVEGEAIAFEGLLLRSDDLPPACPSEPVGTISVRSEDGWYDVVFDGSLEGEVDPARCDGCGDAWFQGMPVGLVCPDLSALLGWDHRPW